MRMTLGITKKTKKPEADVIDGNTCSLHLHVSYTKQVKGEL